MGVNGVWILQMGVYEGKETFQRGLYVWYMLPSAIRGKIINTAWRLV